MTKQGQRKANAISLRAYAKQRGVSVESVSKAITAGRLRDSVVTVGGDPKIGDPDLADREWEENTRARITRRAPAPSRDAAANVPDYLESRARREAAQAELAELEVAERRGELVRVDQARADVIDKFTVVKTRILGVSSRVAQQMPHLATEVVPLLDSLLREALEELAVDDQGADRPTGDDESDESDESDDDDDAA